MTTTTSTQGGQPAAAAVPSASNPASGTPTGTSGIIAGLLMVAGIAWNAGLEARPFHPAIDGISALATHVTPLAAVMACLLPTLRSGKGTSRGRAMTAAAVVAIGFGIFSAIFSVTHPHSVMGIHTVNDILPIAILEAGALLWLVRGRTARLRKARRSTHSTGQDSTAGAAG